jgi:hypothetical protein
VFDKRIILPNGPQYMSETPVSRDPGPDGDPSGVPAGPGDYPRLGSPGWRQVPQSPDWDEAWLAARAEDEDPGDPDEYEDPDNAPPAGLDDDQLAALIAEAREITAEQARAAETWGCARPAPATTTKRHKPGAPDGPDPPGGPKFTFTPTDQPGPPGGYGTWRFSTGIPGQRDLLLDIGPIPTESCDHRHEAKGHDPGVKLRHLAQVRHGTCTGPGCRRPAANCDFEHNVPFESGGRTCLCNGNPKCRHDHRVKQDPRWHVEQIENGNILWTTPSGRQHVTEPTRYPV